MSLLPEMNRRLLITVAAVVLPIGGFLGLLAAGCGESSGPVTYKVSYLGLTCEAPIFAAYENGFFQEEGLNVDLAKTDWDNLRDGLGLGRFDATHHLIMFLLKPIENGLDIKLTGGIHSGCLRLQAGLKTDIRSVEDLRGKKIAISNMGNPPFFFASRVFASHGIDTSKDVEWVVYPSETMELALEQGNVEAVASAEPIGTILLARNKVRNIADQAVDPPYRDEYCCVTVVSGRLARKDPATAAKLTRALLKGAKWVDANQTAAARMAVERGYTAASVEINVQAISKLKYFPGVAQAKRNIQQAAVALQECGFLQPSTDPHELTTRAWLDLDGVTDEWIQSVPVEKIAGGGRPPILTDAGFAALVTSFKDWCRLPLCYCD